MATTFPTEMLIGGQPARGEGAPVTVTNPSSGEVTVTFPGASIAQFEAAIAGARSSFDKGDWAGLHQLERVAILRKFVTRLQDRADDLRALIVTETGCPVSSFALSAQVDGPLRQMIAMLELYPKLPEIEENPLGLEERINVTGGFAQSIRRYLPVGVVAAISAYNFPVQDRKSVV